MSSDVDMAQKVHNMMRISSKWCSMDHVLYEWEDELPPDLDEDGNPLGPDANKFHNGMIDWVEGFIMEYYGINKPLYIPGEVCCAHTWTVEAIKKRCKSPRSAKRIRLQYANEPDPEMPSGPLVDCGVARPSN